MLRLCYRVAKVKAIIVLRPLWLKNGSLKKKNSKKKRLTKRLI